MKWIFYTEISETNKKVTDCHIFYMMNRRTHFYNYRGADKSLAQPTSRCILFDVENISFDASLVIYI